MQSIIVVCNLLYLLFASRDTYLATDIKIFRYLCFIMIVYLHMYNTFKPY